MRVVGGAAMIACGLAWPFRHADRLSDRRRRSGDRLDRIFRILPDVRHGRPKAAVVMNSHRPSRPLRSRADRSRARRRRESPGVADHSGAARCPPLCRAQLPRGRYRRCGSGNAAAVVPAGRNAAGGDVVFGVAVRGRKARLSSPAADVDRASRSTRCDAAARLAHLRPEDLRIDLSPRHPVAARALSRSDPAARHRGAVDRRDRCCPRPDARERQGPHSPRADA